MTLKQLHTFANSKSIQVDYLKINSQALSIKVSSMELIAINSSCNSEIEEKILLAEEISHCMNNSWYNNMGDTYITRANISKAEGKAKVDKIKYLLSLDELINAFEKHIYETDELAEHFNLPKSIIIQALRLYEDNPKLISYRKEHSNDNY